MFDPIITFFETIFLSIGRFFGRIWSAIAWPFMASTSWLRGRHWMIKGPAILIPLVIVGLYVNFTWQTQNWVNFNPNFIDQYKYKDRKSVV